MLMGMVTAYTTFLNLFGTRVKWSGPCWAFGGCTRAVERDAPVLPSRWVGRIHMPRCRLKAAAGCPKAEQEGRGRKKRGGTFPAGKLFYATVLCLAVDAGMWTYRGAVSLRTAVLEGPGKFLVIVAVAAL